MLSETSAACKFQRPCAPYSLFYATKMSSETHDRRRVDVTLMQMTPTRTEPSSCNLALDCRIVSGITVPCLWIKRLRVLILVYRAIATCRIGFLKLGGTQPITSLRPATPRVSIVAVPFSLFPGAFQVTPKTELHGDYRQLMMCEPVKRTLETKASILIQ